VGAPFAVEPTPGRAAACYRRAVAAYLLEHGDTFEQSSLDEDDREGYWPAIGATLATFVLGAVLIAAIVFFLKYVLAVAGAIVALLSM
jgi:hypothetical protein